MTRECDDSRHFADQQQTSSLSWERVASEQYVRTNYPLSHQRLSAGLSFDVGSAHINIGTNSVDGRHYRHWGSSYEYGNPDDDRFSAQTYPGYSDSYDYRGYPSRYESNDNTYRNVYGQIVSPRVITAETPTSIEAQRYYYRQLESQQRLQSTAYSGSDAGYYTYPNDRYTNSFNPELHYANNFDYNGYDNGYSRYYAAHDQYCGPFDPVNNRFDLRYRGTQPVDTYSGQQYVYTEQRNWNDQYASDRGYTFSPNNNRLQSYDGDSYPVGRFSSNYYGVDGDSNDYYPRQASGDWLRMRATLQAMLGHSPSEFNRNVPDDLGCATIVSAALRRAHGVNIHDTNVDGLENSLRRNGYRAIPIRFAQPGDCIIAHRYGNRHGHAAIYVGNGKVVNNSSAEGCVTVAPISKFASNDYESVVAYRRA